MLALVLAASHALTMDGLPTPLGEAFQGPPTTLLVCPTKDWTDTANRLCEQGLQQLQQAIDPAVAAVLQAQQERIVRLERQMAQRKLFIDNFVGCVRSAFVMAGSDLISTAGAKERCQDCREQNPAGFSDLSLVGVKLGQLGSQIAVCKAAAEGGTRATKIVTWTNRVIHGGAIFLNAISTITGKPVIRWKTSQQ